MIFLIGCTCGGQYKVIDTRNVGLSVVYRVQCDGCHAKHKLVKPLDSAGKRIPDLILDSSIAKTKKHADGCHDGNVEQRKTSLTKEIK